MTIEAEIAVLKLRTTECQGWPASQERQEEARRTSLSYTSRYHDPAYTLILDFYFLEE